MKARLSLLISIVLVFVFLLAVGTHSADAQDGQPTDTPEPTRGAQWPPDISRSHESHSPTQVPPKVAGGPDQFGYTWNDSIPFNWIDATLGTDSGLSGDYPSTGPIDIGFSFDFYENTYDQLYFSTNGLVTFGIGSNDYSNTAIPQQAPPNNMIAVFWDDLAIVQSDNSSKVYYQTGTTEGKQYFVIEWYKVTSADSGTKTFEVILFDNGDIVMQYQSLSGYLQSATVGIEDSLGVFGLQYLYNSPGLSNNKAVRFYPPAAKARMHIYPLYQGKFTQANEIMSFGISIRNNGTRGVDVYDLTPVSGWAISLYKSDGVTPLVNTDSDNIIDTGPVDQGSTVDVIAKIQVPGGVNIGDSITANITAISFLDSSTRETVILQAAIPAPFAQVYRDDDNGAMSLYLVQPGAQKVMKTISSDWLGYDPAVAEATNGNFAYVWSKGQCIGSNCEFKNIEYTLLNKYGGTVHEVSTLTDNSATTVNTVDSSPAVAVTPNGRIGILWYRYTFQFINSAPQYNYNIFFAILDAFGNIAYGPVNLTNNTVAGIPLSDSDVPVFDSAQIAATGDNRFALSWVKYHLVSGCSTGDCYLKDIYYTVRDSNGIAVQDITKFTNDTTGSSYEAYSAPNLTDLTGNRVLITWSRSSDGDIYYAVLDSSGTVVRDEINLVGDGLSIDDQNPDAVQLSDGKIVVGWTGGANIRFAVLDATYNHIGPIPLGNLAATTGNDYISITADSAGRAILTWMDSDSKNRRKLYYALVSGNGGILTQPMIFYTSQASIPNIETSFLGYGNTSYSSLISAGVDGAVWSNKSLVSGVVGGVSPVRIIYTNHGQTTATGVALTATLGEGLTYQDDTSGIAPVIVGNFVTWFLPNLNFLDEHQFILNLGVRSTATIGTRYTVTLSLAANEAETIPLDNTASVEVLVLSQVLLPLVIR